MLGIGNGLIQQRLVDDRQPDGAIISQPLSVLHPRESAQSLSNRISATDGKARIHTLSKYAVCSHYHFTEIIFERPAK